LANAAERQRPETRVVSTPSTISPSEMHLKVKPQDLPVQYMQGDFIWSGAVGNDANQSIEAKPFLSRLGRAVVCAHSRGCAYRHIFIHAIGGGTRTTVGRHSYRARV